MINNTKIVVSLEHVGNGWETKENSLSFFDVAEKYVHCDVNSEENFTVLWENPA